MNRLFNQIPQSRLIAYVLLIGLLPIILVGFQLYIASSEVSSLEEDVQATFTRAVIKEKQQANNKAVIDHFKNSDRFYIDKHIESIQLLQPEIEALEKISRQNNFIENEAVTNRLKELRGNNKLVFAEGVVQANPRFTETPETLARPVEVDLNDLQNVLAKIEGIDIGPYKPGPNPPQLLITEFKLEKKSAGEDNEVFSLNLKLLKREFTSEP